ncbi:MAG TPA: hypothetical protein VJ719_00700 [Chthoniobacterales bacterium]|nr:hypothetical protein [Chthoniobacterales bacterium]
MPPPLSATPQRGQRLAGLLAAAALFGATTVFGQRVTENVEGPLYDSNGQVIRYQHSDGSCETYAYDSARQLVRQDPQTGEMSIADEAQTEPDRPHLSRRRRPKPAPTPPSATTLDQRLYTDYNLFFGRTQLNWSVCGRLGTAFGCFRSGNFEGFGHVGALLQSRAVAESAPNTISRYIYIVDTQSGPSKNLVMLWVYKRTEVITPVMYAPTISYVTATVLPLIGGPSAVASMAANDVMVVIGTNQSANIAIFYPGGFTATTSDITPLSNIVAITSDDHGNISVSGTSGLVQFGPSGKLQSYGGGSSFLLNPVQGLTLPSGL